MTLKTAAEYAKEAGLKSLIVASEESGQSVQALNSLFKYRPFIFHAIIEKVVRDNQFEFRVDYKYRIINHVIFQWQYTFSIISANSLALARDKFKESCRSNKNIKIKLLME